MRLQEVFSCPAEGWTLEDQYGIGIHGDMPGKNSSEIVFDLEFPNMRTAFRFIGEFESDFIYRYEVTNAIDSVHDSVTFTITFVNPYCPF
jgi:hypothetical protein